MLCLHFPSSHMIQVRTRRILFILFWVVWIGMIVAAVIIIVLTPKCPARPDQKWWETSVVYTVCTHGFSNSFTYCCQRVYWLFALLTISAHLA